MRTYWYEPGIEHGNPVTTPRFRVNAPQAVLDPATRSRREVRASGMMQIEMEEDLSTIVSAELHADLWGGHPGTANKRVTVNGRSTYPLPETGTAAGHCTHSYPIIPLQLTDLVTGYNALQFACDQGTSFWGHFIVDEAALRVGLRDSHPDLTSLGLSAFDAVVGADPLQTQEGYRLSLFASDESVVDRVIFLGYYEGYDENGNGETLDWHGFDKHRSSVAVIGEVRAPPFACTWDISMLPDQDRMGVRAIVHLKGDPRIHYVTPTTQPLTTPERAGRVYRIDAAGLPAPFWSRAAQPKACILNLDQHPHEIERVELHIVIWDGGRGTVYAPVTLNDQFLPVAGEGAHDVLYRRLPIGPGTLRRGDNQLRVFSDTEHHGIEVLLPGPALMVRTRG
jgi:hypothetical protein